MVEILVQQLDANADFVVLAQWVVPDGSVVEAEAVVCLVETSKATFEVSTPAGGILSHRNRTGDVVSVGAVLATVVQVGEARPPAFSDEGPSDQADGRVSRQALELIAKHGLQLSDLPVTGFITADDVEQYLRVRARASGGDASSLLPLDGVDTRGLTFPSDFIDPLEGRLEPAFLAQMTADGSQFRRLPANEKIAALRSHGASIGENVQLGEGTLILAPHIVLRDNVSIGTEGTVWCGQRLAMGRMARFGARLTLRCQQAIIGSGVFAEDEIIIGGGGHKDPWAVLSVGDNTYIGSWVFINTCRQVLIGREAFVTNHATLLTHNVGHSYIDGFENRFSAVVAEDECQIGINAILYAGSRVGRGAVIGSNSYVVNTIAAGKLAMGVPARAIGDAQQKLSMAQREARGREVFRDFHALLAAKGYDVRLLPDVADTLVLVHGGRELGLAFRPHADLTALPPDVNWVVWTLADAASVPDGGVVMNLDAKRVIGAGDALWTDSIREYLRKRGVRLQPQPWRYGAGLI